MYEDLLSLLTSLDGVAQSPKYHPEGDALFHSLQVFDLALADDAAPPLLAAALFHDVGKADAGRDHDVVGAGYLVDLVPDETCWLVAHHLDLLRSARRTRSRLRGTPRGRNLELLRRYDLGGRSPYARVRSPEEAVSIALEALEGIARG